MIKKIFCLICLSIATFASAQNTKKTEVVDKGLRFCESTYPYKKGVLIANFGTEKRNSLNNEGKGYIAYHKDGKTSIMIPADGNLSGPKGMYIKDHRLYICDVSKIVVYNLDDLKKSPYIINFPKEDLFVNDIAGDGDNIYVSVTNTNKIYKIDISKHSSDLKPKEWLKIEGPNGLLIHKGKMYVASYPADGVLKKENVIYCIDNLKDPTAKKMINTPGKYDGLALSRKGKYIYVSNWSPIEISRLDLVSGKMTPLKINLSKPMEGPADISTDGKNLYIPDLPNDRVIIVKE